MARCCLRRATEAYSPECVEGEFSEVRLDSVLGSSALAEGRFLRISKGILRVQGI
jgi:hypothetical protein